MSDSVLSSRDRVDKADGNFMGLTNLVGEICKINKEDIECHRRSNPGETEEEGKSIRVP